MENDGKWRGQRTRYSSNLLGIELVTLYFHDKYLSMSDRCSPFETPKNVVPDVLTFSAGTKSRGFSLPGIVLDIFPTDTLSPSY